MQPVFELQPWGPLGRSSTMPNVAQQEGAMSESTSTDYSLANETVAHS